MEIKGHDLVMRIDDRLKEKNLKRKALAEACGFNVANVTKWDRYGSLPTADTAYLIAQELGVSVEWLLTGRERDGLSAEERRLLDGWRQLDGRDREDVLGIVEMKLERSTPSSVAEASPSAG
ncbi:MAG: helix-turn-helix domain-containing protein [Treponema sp.]|nr:helix-turn-helix domain-containing protein [Treponema sp.]